MATVLTAAAVLATLVGAGLSPHPWTTRLRWIAFSFFVAPFGPTCFWTWGVGREPEKGWTLRSSLYLLAGTGAAILVLGLLAQVNVASAETWARAVVGIVCVLGLWHATLMTRGRSFLLPLTGIAIAVGLLVAVNGMAIE